MIQCKHGIKSGCFCDKCAENERKPSNSALSDRVMCEKPKPPRVLVSEMKFYKPDGDAAFHNELTDLLDKYLDEYKMDWDMEISK